MISSMDSRSDREKAMSALAAEKRTAVLSRLRQHLYEFMKSQAFTALLKTVVLGERGSALPTWSTLFAETIWQFEQQKPFADIDSSDVLVLGSYEPVSLYLPLVGTPIDARALQRPGFLFLTHVRDNAPDARAGGGCFRLSFYHAGRNQYLDLWVGDKLLRLERLMMRTNGRPATFVQEELNMQTSQLAVLTFHFDGSVSMSHPFPEDTGSVVLPTRFTYHLEGWKDADGRFGTSVTSLKESPVVTDGAPVPIQRTEGLLELIRENAWAHYRAMTHVSVPVAGMACGSFNEHFFITENDLIRPRMPFRGSEKLKLYNLQEILTATSPVGVVPAGKNVFRHTPSGNKPDYEELAVTVRMPAPDPAMPQSSGPQTFWPSAERAFSI